MSFCFKVVITVAIKSSKGDEIYVKISYNHTQNHALPPLSAPHGKELMNAYTADKDQFRLLPPPSWDPCRPPPYRLLLQLRLLPPLRPRLAVPELLDEMPPLLSISLKNDYPIRVTKS